MADKKSKYLDSYFVGGRAKPPKPDDLALRLAVLEAAHDAMVSELDHVKERALQLAGRSGIRARIRWILLGK